MNESGTVDSRNVYATNGQRKSRKITCGKYIRQVETIVLFVLRLVLRAHAPPNADAAPAMLAFVFQPPIAYAPQHPY